jgi:hypothetical protein
MNASTATSMLALRDADPALGVDTAALCPDWQSILSRLTVEAESAPRPSRDWRRRPTRYWRLALAGAVVVAAAISASVVSWPWSQRGPGVVAYGVTKQSNGTVAVRVSLAHPLLPQDLQSQLRAEGVFAVVLVESAPGTCSEPAPTTIPSSSSVLSFPTTIARGEGFVVDPAAIPAGAVLVVGLPQRGSIPAGTPPVAGLWVTFSTPSCIGQVVTGPARPTDVSPTN